MRTVEEIEAEIYKVEKAEMGASYFNTYKGEHNMNNKKINDAIKAERNEYQRHYRATHKEKIKAINDRYWKKKALKRLESEQKDELEAELKTAETEAE